MATIARLNVALAMDSKDFDSGVKNATASAESLSSKLGKIGAGMTAGITLPIIGAAAAAVKFSTDLNTGMANIASLGVASDRVTELKGNIQQMAIATGKSTDDLAQGAYQVISAFGDTADTAAILEINAKSAAAGLADTSEAIALTSAVTKGYGDTSAKAVQQVSDLALQTVALGQTTFPELAGSIGAVTPLAANLGVAQEELFAVMATGTGVTGNASAVSTQMRGTLQSLMAPTEDMTKLMTSMGYSTAQAMIQGEGYQGAMAAIVAASKASNTPLQKYIGSIEGQTLALALGGPLADSYAEKLEAMGGAVGATDKAFTAQTQGINKAGFTMKQLAIRAQVVAQKIGDGLAPALAAVFDIITPLVDKVVELADWFATADTNTQMLIVGAVALVAALGPLLAMAPMIAGAVGVLGAVLGALVSPIGLVVAAIVALGVAWATNFGGIRNITMSVLTPIMDGLQSFSLYIGAVLEDGDYLNDWLTHLPTAIQPAVEKFGEMVAELKKWFDLATTGDFSGLWNEVGNALNSVRVAVAEFDWADYVTSLDWGGYIKTVLDWGTYITATLSDWGMYVINLDWGGYVTTLSDWGTYITATLADWGTYVVSLDWGGYIKPLTDWGTYITATLSDWGTYITSLDWGGYIKSLTDWGMYITATISDWSSYVSKLAWGDYIGKLWTGYVTKLSWSDYVSKLNWSDFVSKLDWTLWIPALVWSVVVTPVRWASWIPQLLWDNVISKLSWDGFIKAITNWDTWISMLQWSTFVFPVLWPAFIDKLGVTQWIEAIGKSPQWSSFISKLNWLAVIPGFTWPSWVTSLTWGDFVPKLLWPAIEAPTWLDFIDKLKWPEFKAPDWGDFIPDLKWPNVPSFPGWADILRSLGWGGPPATGTGNPNGTGGSSGTTTPSGGTVTPPGGIGLPADLFKASGGPVTRGVPYIVGDGPGPELFIPNVNGQIIPNNELGSWWDTGTGGGGAGVNIGTVVVNNEIDIRELAYQVAGYQARRR